MQILTGNEDYSTDPETLGQLLRSGYWRDPTFEVSEEYRAPLESDRRYCCSAITCKFTPTQECVKSESR